MAEETTAAETQQAEQATETVDWQAKYEAMRQHARDWEKQAKANKGAAEELEKLKAEQMTEQEKAVARAEKAEAELAQIQAEQQRAADAAKVARDAGVPVELLEFLPDKETMERFAKKYAETLPDVHAAAGTSGSRVIREGRKQTASEAFAAALTEAGF